ncbi:MAG TPA: methyltransferase [Verrucomicrobiae bacterium]|nr:methyltransferase [Verrucomicrobiae bacterium]
MKPLSSGDNPLAPVAEIIRRHGAGCSPKELQAAVNVTFHRFESECYDELHQDMWQSLPVQVNLLAGDAIRGGVAAERIRLLDCGCGTGLATDCLLRSPIGERIESVDLLDTSAEMLARAEERRKNSWRKPGKAMQGLIEGIAGDEAYNLVITCSVLHHVPDLSSFLKSVRFLQKDQEKGLFIHLQDPNGDYTDDPERLRREAEVAQKAPEWMTRFSPRRVLGRLRREIAGEQGQDYLSKTNRELIRQGLISSPLSTEDLFRITDIQVRDGGGISTEQMKGWLPDYEMVSRRSYSFFGVLRSNLPPKLLALEEELTAKGAANGGHVAAVWSRSGTGS